MESKVSWVFIRKNENKDLVYVKTYGSITKMADSETITVGNDIKSEWAVRNMLKSGKYVDDKYHIEKTIISRSKKI